MGGGKIVPSVATALSTLMSIPVAIGTMLSPRTVFALVGGGGDGGDGGGRRGGGGGGGSGGGGRFGLG